MNRSFARRSLLRLALLSGASAIAACSVAQGGGVSTLTIDVARIVTDGGAIIAALKGALAIPALSVLLGPNLVTAQAALVAADMALTEIESLTGGTLVLSIDTARVQSLVQSLLADAQSVLAMMQGVLPSLPGNPSALPTALAAVIASVQTLIPLVQLAAGLTGSKASGLPMSETEALAIAARFEG